ncbi:MAG TPA: c-type cytochrome domain-containing protein [Methylomirabilota bacterium]|nr:c-type cytochrome domain-containing protein [Methylomirabilota bacterium]
MPASHIRWTICSFLVIALSLGEVGSSRAEAIFKEEIAPVLVRECAGCHNAEKAKGGYRLDTVGAMLRAGESGRAPIVPGKPDESYLFNLIATSDVDDRMPQKDEPLDSKVIQLVREWISSGASFAGCDTNEPLSGMVAAPHPAPPAAYPRPLPLRAVGFGPTSEVVAVSGYHEVTVWKSDDGALQGRITNAPSSIQSLAYSPDGSLLALAGGNAGRQGEVSLFALGDGAKRVLGRFNDVMLKVTFSPDGKLLVGGGSDNSIHVWEAASGKELRVIQQHADWVTSVAITPDGKQIISASRDKTARTYDLDTGELQTTYAEHEGAVWVALPVAGKDQVVSCGRDRSIRVWRTADGSTVAKIERLSAEPLDLAFANERLWAAFSDGTVREIDLAKKAILRTHKVGSLPVYTVAAGKDSVAAGTHEGSVHIFRPNAETPFSFVAAPGLNR